MPTPRAGTGPDLAEPRWLSPAQLQAWRSFTIMLARLPAALEWQLQADSQLSYVEYYVLAGLSDQPGDRMRLSRLAALTNAELSRLSHMIGRLERRGLVVREPDAEDGRYANAVLTRAGRDLLAATAPCHVAWVRELVIDALDEDQLHGLAEVADRIIDRIDAHQPSANARGTDRPCPS